MNLRLFLCVLGIWIGAIIALRVAGQYLLHPGDWKGTLILFAVSFPLAAWIVGSYAVAFNCRKSICLPARSRFRCPRSCSTHSSVHSFRSCFRTWLQRWQECSGGGCFGAARAPWWV